MIPAVQTMANAFMDGKCQPHDFPQPKTGYGETLPRMNPGLANGAPAQASQDEPKRAPFPTSSGSGWKTDRYR
jgi:hypothetical protein